MEWPVREVRQLEMPVRDDTRTFAPSIHFLSRYPSVPVRRKEGQDQEEETGPVPGARATERTGRRTPLPPRTPPPPRAYDSRTTKTTMVAMMLMSEML